MLNFYFYDFGARLTLDPNIYYRTKYNEKQPELLHGKARAYILDSCLEEEK